MVLDGNLECLGHAQPSSHSQSSLTWQSGQGAQGLQV